MKIPKIKSYIRLVLVFFIILASVHLIQILFFQYGVTRNILPRNRREKQDMLLYIRDSIHQKLNQNPHFNLEEYIRRENKRFHRIKLEFVNKEQIEIQKVRPNSLLKVVLPDRQNRFAVAVKINTKPYSGYLVLYSTELNRLNAELRLFTFFMLATVLPALLMGFLIFRKVYHRSSQLVSAVERISQGDYQVRTNIPGSDEFSLLGEAFNKMAASIEKSTQALKLIDQQRRKFIADISHELATPLTSIQGYVETLQMEDLQLDKHEQQEYLKIVLDETERLSYLVKDLLEIARMDAGTISLIYDRIDCRHFFQDFAKRNYLKLKEKQVNLSWRADPDQSISADYRRLEQIFQNLLDNALKHSAQLHQVEIIVVDTPQTILISFRDDGSGISSEQMERVFQSNNEPDSLISSHGLGLSIVKRLVELHGGTIRVESQVNVGTTFWIEFPKM